MIGRLLRALLFIGSVVVIFGLGVTIFDVDMVVVLPLTLLAAAGVIGYIIEQFESVEMGKITENPVKKRA